MANQMMKTSQDLVSKIREETRIEVLGRNWMSYDARWQMAVVQSFGWDAGNQLNQKVTRDMGNTMMTGCMKATGISHVANIQELRDILVTTVCLNWSDALKKNCLECQSETSILYEIHQCIIFDNISKANVTNKYECGCFALRAGFCDALNLEISQECKSCLMKGEDKYEMVLTVKNWQKMRR